MENSSLNRATIQVANTREICGRATAPQVNRFQDRIRKVCALVRATLILPAPLSAMLLMAFAVPSHANVISTATGTVTCSNFSLEFTGIELNPSVTYSVHYSFTLNPTSGPAITIANSVPIPAGTAGSFDVTATGSLTLTQTFTITAASATLFADSTAQNTVPIMFTSTTIACGGAGSCPATFGFWKHHVFPATVLTSGLTIGGVHYTASQLKTILNNPGQGNAITILGPQLVAALLNKAAGAVDNSAADAAIIAAEALLSTQSLNLLTSVVEPSSPLGQALIDQASILDGYNSGNFHSCQEP